MCSLPGQLLLAARCEIAADESGEQSTGNDIDRMFGVRGPFGSETRRTRSSPLAFVPVSNNDICSGMSHRPSIQKPCLLPVSRSDALFTAA